VLEVEIVKTLSIHHRDALFFSVRGIYQHAFHDLPNGLLVQVGTEQRQ
jgi:hypothetical protein